MPCFSHARDTFALLVLASAFVVSAGCEAGGDLTEAQLASAAQSGQVSLKYISGSGQLGPAGNLLPDSLVLQTLDRRGKPVAGVYVQITATQGGGTLSPSGGTTNAQGMFSSAWTLGSSGSQVATARAPADGTVSRRGGRDSVVVFTASLTTASLSAIEVLPSSVTAEVGQTVQLRVADGAGNPLSGTAVAWASDNATVASVDAAGLVTMRTRGQARITSRVGSVEANATVTVTDAAAGTLVVTPARATLYGAGTSITVQAEARDGNGVRIAAPSIRWTSANPDIAMVDSLGRVTSRALGTTLIVASASCCSSASAEVIVAAPTPITVTVSATPGDGQVTLNATAPAGGTAPYQYQWHGGTTDPGASPTSATALSGLISLNATHAGLVNGTPYYYRLVITDAQNSRAVSAPVNATPRASSAAGAYPNLPSGLTVIGGSDGSVEELNGHAFGIADFGRWQMDASAPASHIQVVSDATNPAGSGASLRYTWNQAYNPRSGSATANGFAGGPYRELYIMTRIFLETGGWSGFGNKYFYVGAASGARHNSGSPTQYYSTRESDGRLRFINQNGTSIVLINSAGAGPAGNGTTPLATGRWLNIEYRLVSQSSPTVGDGQIYVWVNGVLVGYNTAVSWVGAGDPIGFSGMEWYGDANTVTSTSYYRIGEVFIAGRR